MAPRITGTYIKSTTTGEAVRAFVPNSVDRAAIANHITAPVCPRVHERPRRWMTVREWRARGVEQGAGCDQVALVHQALCQRLGVHPGVDPAEQARGFGHEAATRRRLGVQVTKIWAHSPDSHTPP